MRSLTEWESLLVNQIRSIALIGELDLTIELEHELGALLKSRITQAPDIRQGIELIARSYPACLATYLVAHGVFQYRSGDYWTMIDTNLGCQSSLVNSRWGSFFEQFLVKNGLQDFQAAATKGHRYLTKILLHGGIPDYCLPDFFNYLLLPWVDKDDDPNPNINEIIIEWLSSTAIKQVDLPVARFLDYGEAVARDFVSRCVHMARQFAEDETPRSAGEYGLPQRVVDCFIGVWQKSRKSSQRHTSGVMLRRPRIHLDPWGDGISIYLPVEHIGEADKRPTVRWIVQDQAVRVKVALDESGWISEPHNFLVGHHDPATKYHIRLEVADNNWREWDIGILSDLGIAAFDPISGYQLDYSAALPSIDLWLLFKSDDPVQSVRGIKREILPLLADQWASYAVERWDLTHASEITIGGQTVSIERSSQPLIQSEDQCGIYCKAPFILIPNQSDTDLPRWRMSISGPDGLILSNCPLHEVQEVEVDDDGLHLDLSSNHLIGKDAFGSYEVYLYGALGRGNDTKLNITIVPGFKVKGADTIRLPTQDGLPQALTLHITVDEHIKINIPSPAVSVQLIELGMYQAVVGEKYVGDLLPLEIAKAGSISTFTVVASIPLRTLRWALIDE